MATFNSSSAYALTPARPYLVLQGDGYTFNQEDLLQQYISYIDRKETTVRSYISCIRQYFAWRAVNRITSPPQREEIRTYRDHLAGSDLAAGTQAQYLRAVKHFFKWTAAEGYYPNIADNIHGAKVRNDCHKKDALPRDRTEDVANTIDRSTEAGRRLYAIYLLCAENGLRTVEVHRADVGDIKIIDGDPYLYVQPKGHDSKDSPKYLFPDVKAAIDEYLEIRSEKVTPKSPLFTSTSNRSKGGRLSTVSISTMLKGLLVYNGFDSDRITAHSLRATAATAAFEAGLTIYEVQQLMGHVDPATTEIYIKDQNIFAIEKKGRLAINRYLKGEATHKILPELEAELMTLTPAEQAQLLAEIRARKGASK